MFLNSRFLNPYSPREYRFSNSIELIRGMSLIGSGGSDQSVGRFSLSPRGAGIISHFDAPSNPPGRGAWSIVERCMRATGISAAVAHGILMHSSVIVRDVYIHGFSGNGIQINADVNRTPPTDGNHWQIQNCFVSACMDGLHVEGGDSSAGSRLPWIVEITEDGGLMMPVFTATPTSPAGPITTP